MKVAENVFVEMAAAMLIGKSPETQKPVGDTKRFLFLVNRTLIPTKLVLTVEPGVSNYEVWWTGATGSFKLGLPVTEGATQRFTLSNPTVSVLVEQTGPEPFLAGFLSREQLDEAHKLAAAQVEQLSLGELKQLSPATEKLRDVFVRRSNFLKKRVKSNHDADMERRISAARAAARKYSGDEKTVERIYHLFM